MQKGSRIRRDLVIALMLKGYRNKQIAVELGVSERTVKDHLWREYKLVGVGSRIEYLIKAHNEVVSNGLSKKIAHMITGGSDGECKFT